MVSTATRQRWEKIGSHVLLVPFLLFALFPFYFMAITSVGGVAVSLNAWCSRCRIA